MPERRQRLVILPGLEFNHRQHVPGVRSKRIERGGQPRRRQRILGMAEIGLDLRIIADDRGIARLEFARLRGLDRRLGRLHEAVIEHGTPRGMAPRRGRAPARSPCPRPPGLRRRSARAIARVAPTGGSSPRVAQGIGASGIGACVVWVEPDRHREAGGRPRQLSRIVRAQQQHPAEIGVERLRNIRAAHGHMRGLAVQQRDLQRGRNGRSDVAFDRQQVMRVAIEAARPDLETAARIQPAAP